MSSVWSRLQAFLLLSFLSLTVSAGANEEIVELPLQRAQCICGVVLYPNGDPVEGAKVEELGSDWKSSLRSVNSDSEGHFVLTPIKGRDVYYIQITAPTTGVNPLRVPIQISRFRGTKLLRLQLHLA